MRPFVRRIRLMGHRCLPWRDDFLVVPGPGVDTPADTEDARRASADIGRLMRKLGLRRHPEKGTWVYGAFKVEHLGTEIETKEMKLCLPSGKVDRMHSLTRALLLESVKNRR